MYSIGEFSIIAEISSKTLRYYDEINLFKPANIDGNNSYRYYAKSQIGEINFIKDLKKYGLSLNEIKKLKDSNDKKNLNKILINQRFIIEQRINELKKSKDEIEKKIAEDKLWETKNIEYSIDKVKIESFMVAFVRECIEFKQVNALIGKLYELINEKNLKTKGKHSIKIYENDDEYSDVEVFIQIENPIEDLSLNKYIKGFNGGTFLKTTHIGIKDKGTSYSNIYDFARINNYELIDEPIENYEIISGKFMIDIMFKIKN